jgi:hypothetical protein
VWEKKICGKGAKDSAADQREPVLLPSVHLYPYTYWHRILGDIRVEKRKGRYVDQMD